MAITDWTKPLYGNFTQYAGNTKADRDSTYIGINPLYTQGWDWKSGQPLTIGDYTGANPYQYGSAANEYAGLNGLQNTDGWQTYGSGANEYKAYADSQQNGGFIGQLGPDGVEGNAYFSAPTGQRFLGDIMQNDPKLWKILQPYANAYGSYDDKYGYTIPEEYYKAGTSALGRWTTKGDWKGPARVISLILSAYGGALMEGAGMLGEGLNAGTSAFPSAAGDGFYNWADALGGGMSGLGEAGGGGMSFFDDILGNADPSAWGDLSGLSDDFEMFDWGSLGGGNSSILDNFDPSLWGSTSEDALGGYGMLDNVNTTYGEFLQSTNPNWMQQLVDKGVPGDWVQKIASLNSSSAPPGTSTLLKKLLGGGSGGSGGGIINPDGSVNIGNLLGGGLSAAGIGGMLNYGLNQTPDLSKLNAAYAALDPTAVTREYDINTDTGRNALNTSLTNRGVMGSSFGNADIANFNTTRDIGRRSLLNAGVGQQANIANMILTGQNNNVRYKNQLIGSALNSLGLLGS